MQTNSAQRSPTPRTSRLPLGWLAAGFGLLLVLASLYAQYAGPTAWSGVLEPASHDGTMSIYVTPDVLLEPGTYDLRLSYRQPPRMLEITTGRYSVRVSSTELPGWHASGFLEGQRTRRKGASRPRVSGNVVARIPQHLEAPLRLEVQGAGSAQLSVTIRLTKFDYRIPLWAGFLLIALGLLFDPSVRSRVEGLLARS
ncbi:MAG TPA: hypothetical protein ENK19_02355 [Acidobacteria bacterium]|nr:hypothetical protein [Acidobacteriota bacterium]